MIFCWPSWTGDETLTGLTPDPIYWTTLYLMCADRYSGIREVVYQNSAASLCFWTCVLACLRLASHSHLQPLPLPLTILRSISFCYLFQLNTLHNQTLFSDSKATANTSLSICLHPCSTTTVVSTSMAVCSRWRIIWRVYSSIKLMIHIDRLDRKRTSNDYDPPTRLTTELF